MNVLISSLGESPAVITETVDAVEREEHIRIDRVVTIGTREWSVELSQEALQEEFMCFEGGRITYLPLQIEGRDLLRETDHLEFLHAVATQLRMYRFADTYLSLAGGRKTMSALMAIAAQIYGARMLCHIIPLDEELERQGEIQIWHTLPQAEQQRILHPPAEKVRLVRLPLISLFPLLQDFLRALQGQMDVEPQAVRLLHDSGLIWREAGMLKRTPSGEQLYAVLADIEQLPPPSERRPEEKVTIHDHGYGGKRGRVEAYARQLAQLPWVTSVRTIPYGNKPRTALRTIHEDGRIEVDVKTGEFSAGLEVRTTAQTRGQTERVAKELERWLRL
ncbi:MAG TPA: CRISPR-associated ring nuclease [Alphaproteobacteria bacterium]|nr:CRISPR-associated ring nuclease [Alphaproteobacteria bacterium]